MKPFLPFTLLFVIAASAFAQTRPPVAPVRPVVDNYFGIKVTDTWTHFTAWVLR